MKEQGISLIALLLVFTAVNAEDWADPKFLPPDVTEPGNVTFNDDTDFVKIYFDEEVDGEVHLARINYKGSTKPTIKCDKLELLNASVRKDDSYWLLLLNGRQNYENKDMRTYNVWISIGSEQQMAIIHVRDVNDIPPVLKHQSQYCSVEENWHGTTICTMQLEETDTVCPDTWFEVHESGSSDDESKIFSLNVQPTNKCNKELTLEVNENLDFETNSVYMLEITAHDGNFTASTTIVINVKDMPDMPPIWTMRSPTQTIVELEEFQLNFTARDGDTEVNEAIKYTIQVDADQKKYFKLNGKTGLLDVKPIHREELLSDIIKINATAYDSHNESKYEFIFMVKDVNNYSPEIKPCNLTFKFDEGTTDTLTGIIITDLDQIENGTFHVTLEDNPEGNFTQAFRVIPDIGYQNGSFSITVTDPKPLDFEDEDWKEFSFQIVATEQADSTHCMKCKVSVALNDRNDEKPTFLNLENANVTENAADGTFIKKLIAKDKDAGDVMTYSSVSTSVKVDPSTGIVTAVEREFDYELQHQMVIQVEVHDNGSHYTYDQFIIDILDENDNPPKLYMPSEKLSIAENETIGYVVTNAITAKDVDTKAVLYFYINWDGSSATKQGVPLKKEDFEYTFKVNPDCSECKAEESSACTCLEVAKNITWEVMEAVYINVTVRDNTTEVGDDENSALLVVLIQDVNNNPPIFEPISDLSVEENTASEWKIGSSVATDKDGPGNNNVSYTLIEINDTLPNLVKIDQRGVLLVDKDKEIDYEKYQELYYTVIASDGVHSPEINITITVVDVNDNTPIISNPITTPIPITENSKSGTYIYQVIATDEDKSEPFSELRYLLDSAANSDVASLFAVDFYNGNITVNLKTDHDVLDYESSKKEYEIRVLVRDNFLTNSTSNSNFATTTVTVSLVDENDNPPVFRIPSPTCEVQKLENLGKDQFLVTISALDADTSYENNHVDYDITKITAMKDYFKPPPDEGDPLFKINSTSGQIYSGVPLEGYFGSYSVEIKGTNPDTKIHQEAHETYIICIEDINDHDPKIMFPVKDQIIRLKDVQRLDQPLNTYDSGTLDRLYAKDEDYDDNARIDFNISDAGSGNATDYFYIAPVDDSTAILKLKKSFDIRMDREFKTIISASDRGKPPGSDKVTVTFQVLTDGHDPNFVDDSEVTQFSENSLEESFQIQPAEDIDNLYKTPDEKDKIFYFIAEGNDQGFFSIDKNTGLINLAKELDYEDKTMHLLWIVATNKESDPNGSNKLNLTIEVVNENDCFPEFDAELYAGGITPGDKPGMQILKFNASDQDADDKLTYNIVPGTMKANDSLKAHVDELDLIPETGVLNLNFVPDNTMSGYFSFKVAAVDRANHTATVDVLVFIISNANKESFIFENHKEFVDTQKGNIQNVLTQFLGFHCTVDQALPVKKSNLKEVTNRTSVTTHFVDQSKMLPVENSVIDLLVNEKATTLRPEFLKYQLNWVDVGRDNKSDKASNLDGLTQTILIVVCALLATLVLLLLAAFFFRTRSLNQRLEALSQTKFGSQDSGLNRVNMNVPNTNQHALEGSNPVWNEDLNNQDNISQGSGDSELVGIEDNPEFKPQDNLTGDSRRGSKNPFFENMGLVPEWPPDNEDENQNDVKDTNFSFGPPQPNTPTTEL